MVTALLSSDEILAAVAALPDLAKDATRDSRSSQTLNDAFETIPTMLDV